MEIVLKRQKLSAPLDTSVYQNLKVLFIHYCILNSLSALLLFPIIWSSSLPPECPLDVVDCQGKAHDWLIVILKGFIYLFPISQDCKQSDNWLIPPSDSCNRSYDKLFIVHSSVFTSLKLCWCCQRSHEFCFTEQIIYIQIQLQLLRFDLYEI